MDLKEIRQIIELMKRNDLSLFHMEREGFKIKLRKGVDFDAVMSKLGNGGGGYAAPAPAPAVAEAPPATLPSVTVAPEVEGAAAPGSYRIPSPMVGTFYRSSGPGEKPFITIGDTVEEGTTVCIIEAMKVMNEIKAETSGVITRILVEDTSAVQYDTPLFEVKPA